jgi:hypothetical protein
MSSKNKKPSITTMLKARYSNGNKVFILCYAFAGPGLILEGEIGLVTTADYPVVNEYGKTTGKQTDYSYLVQTDHGIFDKIEGEVYPSFVEAAKIFAKAFLKPLK